MYPELCFCGVGDGADEDSPTRQHILRNPEFFVDSQAASVDRAREPVQSVLKRDAEEAGVLGLPDFVGVLPRAFRSVVLLGIT